VRRYAEVTVRVRIYADGRLALAKALLSVRQEIGGTVSSTEGFAWESVGRNRVKLLPPTAAPAQPTKEE
jgi:hypothetical protein